ncbi:MAG TPA: hypothetical protein VNQ32_07755 [Steroidobacteraceae bacterium]|nr:hypothetical protein [Steroidobacteraceae bacterium]
MTRLSFAVALLAASPLTFAEVVQLECKGTSPTGKQQTFAVSYDEKEGWVDDNGSIKMRDGVSAYYLKGIKVMVDKETMEYSTRETTAGEKFKGKCLKVEPKA